jgi:hypothetical protein
LLLLLLLLIEPLHALLELFLVVGLLKRFEWWKDIP